MAGVKTGFVMPTGYEQYQRSAEEKRQIAKAMLAQGMAPLNNPTSWAQVLGQWAQNAAGYRMLGKADDQESSTNKLILGDYGRRMSEAQADAASMDPVQWGNKWGGDSMLADTPLAKGMMEAYSKVLEKRNAPENLPKPTDAVIPMPDGTAAVNPLYITAHRGAGGFETQGFPTSMAWPYAKQPQQPPVSGQTLLDQARTVGSTPGADPSMIGQRAPDGMSNGKPVWFINGHYYDNPEGK